MGAQYSRKNYQQGGGSAFFNQFWGLNGEIDAYRNNINIEKRAFIAFPNNCTLNYDILLISNFKFLGEYSWLIDAYDHAIYFCITWAQPKPNFQFG